MEEWMTALRANRTEAAWDLFINSYRRLILSAIRHYVKEHDDVMDVFASACEALREQDMRRLRKYVDKPAHTARFGTWLVAVVRNLTVDWFRSRDGRHQLPAFITSLPPLQQQLVKLIFLEGRSHTECYGYLQTNGWPDLSFPAFMAEVRATYLALEPRKRGAIWRDLAPDSPSDEQHWDNPVDATLAFERVHAALATLAPEDRLAVQLYVIDELPAEQVAGILGLPNAKAVYNRVYRALASVRAELEEAGVRRADL